MQNLLEGSKKTLGEQVRIIMVSSQHKTSISFYCVEHEAKVFLRLKWFDICTLSCYVRPKFEYARLVATLCSDSLSIHTGFSRSSSLSFFSLFGRKPWLESVEKSDTSPSGQLRKVLQFIVTHRSPALLIGRNHT